MSALETFKAKMVLTMAAKSSRNKSLTDRLCRRLLDKAVARPAEDDFMRDELVDNDLGFDPDELADYQAGRTGRG
ncbi:MAG: hypothetical protein AAFY42_13990 [Pseudomonadota bacterium]